MSSSLNVAIFLESKVTVGGGFQQSLSTIEILESKKENTNYNFIYFTSIRGNVDLLRAKNIECHYFKVSKLSDLIVELRKILLFSAILDKVFKYNPYDDQLKKYDIDLILFLSPTFFSSRFTEINYIITLWDQCHRDRVEFPEIRNFLEFSKREYLNEKVLTRAFKIFVDAKISKTRLISRYGIDASRIEVAPFLPSLSITKNQLTEDNTEGEYLFYPAQFWSHKNHILLLEALSLLKDRNKLIKLILTGSDQGNKQNILNKIKELGLEEQVQLKGFLKDHEISDLYKRCKAVVMPSFFGPTNLPPLEAIFFSKPCFYPKQHLEENEFKNFVIEFDYLSPKDLSSKIEDLYENRIDYSKLIQNGRDYLSKFDKNFYWKVIENSLQEFHQICKNWK